MPVLIAQLLLTSALLTRPLVGFTTDEAIHAAYGAALLHDLAQGDPRSALLDLGDQVRWPPLGSVLQLPGLAAFGVSEAGHRLAVLLWLLPSAAALAAGALALQQRRRDPPDYVAALCLPDGCPDVDRILRSIRRGFTLVTLVRLSERQFGRGSRVLLYRCLGKAPLPAGPARGEP